MTGGEFVRRVCKLARRRGWKCEWHPDQGKGSHGMLYLNGRLTTVRYVKDDLKKGTLHAMLKQLDISLDDLREG